MADSAPRATIRHSKSAVEVGFGGVKAGLGGPSNDGAIQSGVIYTKTNADSVSGDTLSVASSTSTKKIRHSVSFSLKNLGGGRGRGEGGGNGGGGGCCDSRKVICCSSTSSVEAIKEGENVTGDLVENSFFSHSEIASASGREAASLSPPASAASSSTGAANSAVAVARSPSVTVANFIHCKLCLCDYPPREMVQLANCRCLFCADCVTTYIVTAIENGDVLEITCPDGDCPAQVNVVESNQIRQMVDEETFATYLRFRTLREIESDPNGTWCPSIGCETICHVCRVDGDAVSEKWSPRQPVTCPTCHLVFCSVCKSQWHPDGECHNPFLLTSSSSNFGAASNSRRRSQRAESEIVTRSNNNNAGGGGGGGNFFQNFLRRGPAAMEAPGADGALDSSPIKRCPICHILIEREEGCAQMMCKRCKHVFCWYCLESLDNDFLLRHYDRGPCKNKLGHSRASVIWHRTQVVGIFAGFGMLLLMASPFLLLAAPCILCCKCSCCHCLDIDDVEWYEGKGSPGTREARQKRLAKSFGAASSTSVAADSDDEVDDYDNVPSFQSWEIKRKKSKDKTGEKTTTTTETTEKTTALTPTTEKTLTTPTNVDSDKPNDSTYSSGSQGEKEKTPEAESEKGKKATMLSPEE